MTTATPVALVTAQDNHERLEKLSRKWAPKIEAQIQELQDHLFPTTEACEKVALELAALDIKYDLLPGQILDAELRLADIWRELDGDGGINEQMEVIAAGVMLDLCGETYEEKGKIKFTYPNDPARARALKQRLLGGTDYTALAAATTDEEREAAVLPGHTEYKALNAEKTNLEHEQMQLKARVEDAERGLKEYGRHNQALVARLDNLTARMGR